MLFQNMNEILFTILIPGPESIMFCENSGLTLGCCNNDVNNNHNNNIVLWSEAVYVGALKFMPLQDLHFYGSPEIGAVTKVRLEEVLKKKLQWRMS